MMESTSKRTWRATGTPGRRVAGLALVWLALVAVPAAAQVPQDMSFSGRLVDDAGVPLASPVTLDLSIYDMETGGTVLHAERHGPVTLDAEGNFAVLMGTGTDIGLPFQFDAALFSEVERYVQVVLIAPTLEVLTPRMPLASVPWALVAQQAYEIVQHPGAPRFEDCGDGTVADHQTGLQWEKKTGTVGSNISCQTVGCPDPHVVNNIYTWSNTGTAPDGGAFTDFLQKLNDPAFGGESGAGIYGSPPTTGCFAGHCDWRLPIIGELGTILIGRDAAPGQATTCSVAPCIDPDFAAIGGPTGSSNYWSASTNADNTIGVWTAHFSNGNVFHQDKPFNDLYVRAVRAGSCK